MGLFGVRYEGRRWVAVRSTLAGGRAEKLVAEAAGRRGYVSMNLYRLRGGARLYPCEMPAADVRSFVLGLAVEGGTIPRRGAAQ
ncbi:hypothetical protein DLJ49_11970 [Rhodovulum sp. 12E13]|nr:hypothetical protein DLJ49_11970 [Rhodovulum sp. 12E13]